ncbi:hypothetical protein [Nocardia farcinica]|uniref:hypothetical protein n=1 Tax=Nocardia farcinica TaxID=37329 RepID=UPI0018D2D963|nr:hypothetical protein [Nocardia farcinica]
MLQVIGVQQPYVASRAILGECGDDLDPWQLLVPVFADPGWHRRIETSKMTSPPEPAGYLATVTDQTDG